ncbi:MAG TPA: ERF family protein [Phycisphaerae bacterium]|nr:ERF family protein [Phycisphaerae bacterium]HRY69074.1 ERF family protein [Phycisphaerae bacterium]HSA25951.1 ERF family protein [Phycisphaerae bacterium]
MDHSHTPEADDTILTVPWAADDRPPVTQIRCSPTIDKLSAAMAKVGSEVCGVQKSGWNQFHKYAYAKLEDYLKALAPILAQHGLFVLVSAGEVIDVVKPDQTDKKKQRLVRVTLTQRVIHASGEWIEGQTVGEGEDTSDKAVYKAITGARKYGLSCLFNLATTDDPEDDGAGDAAPPAPQAQHAHRPPQSAPPRNGGNGAGPRPSKGQMDLLARARELYERLGREGRIEVSGQIGMPAGSKLSEQSAEMISKFCTTAETYLSVGAAAQ